MHTRPPGPVRGSGALLRWWPPAWLLLFIVPVLVAPPAQASSATATQDRLDALATRYAKLETDLAKTESRSAQLKADLASAERVLAERSRDLTARAVYMYKQGGQAAMLGDLFLAPNAEAFRKRLEVLEVVSARDALVVDEVQIAQARKRDLSADLQRTRRRQEDVLSALRKQQIELQDELAAALTKEREQEQKRARQEKERTRAAERDGAKPKARQQGRSQQDLAVPVVPKGRFALPIVGPVGFADTWGAPRSGGRRHQGTDIMAPCGAKVVAVADGIVSGTDQGGNGGTMLWMRASNGDTYLYAHLRGYADGVGPGKTVSAGELVGFNGNSGNARRGPCHVHFEWHPSGGAAVNPYRLLRSMV